MYIFVLCLQFAALVGVIFIIEMGAGIAGFVLKGKVKGFVNTEMKDSMTNYKNGNSAGVTLTWDQTQQNVSLAWQFKGISVKSCPVKTSFVNYIKFYNVLIVDLFDVISGSDWGHCIGVGSERLPGPSY